MSWRDVACRSAEFRTISRHDQATAAATAAAAVYKRRKDGEGKKTDKNEEGSRDLARPGQITGLPRRRLYQR